MSIIIFIVVMAACWYLLRKNRLGKHIYAVGSDPYVSQISGIPVRRVRFLSYLICGILVGVASAYMASRLGGGGPKIGVGYELDSITAVVIGGVSLAGRIRQPAEHLRRGAHHRRVLQHHESAQRQCVPADRSQRGGVDCRGFILFEEESMR